MAINKPFITPKNEKARLKALYEYDILNTVTEEEYDRIAKIAAEIFDVPVTFISLLDENNQWNKASHGIDMQIIPREIAFCNHTILNPYDVLVVPDLRKDERFANNPLVANAPNVVRVEKKSQRFRNCRATIKEGKYSAERICQISFTRYKNSGGKYFNACRNTI